MSGSQMYSYGYYDKKHDILCRTRVKNNKPFHHGIAQREELLLDIYETVCVA